MAVFGNPADQRHLREKRGSPCISSRKLRNKSYSRACKQKATMRMRLTIATFFAFIAGSTQDTCYWPNGQVAGSGLLPCPRASNLPASSAVNCCWNTDACTSNGLCITLEYNVFYRGGCTDQAWNGCPAYCLNGV